MNFLLNTAGENDTLQMIIDAVISWCLDSGIKIVISLIVLAVSFRVINLISRKIEGRFKANAKHDKTIVKVLGYIGKVQIIPFITFHKL